MYRSIFLKLFNRKFSKKEKVQKFGDLKNEVFLFSWISEYFQKAHRSDSSHVITDKVCNDLDFDELFMYLDRTKSKVGQQSLYSRLRLIDVVNQIDAEDENLIKRISADENLRASLEKQLSRLNSTEAFYISKLFQDKIIKAPSWYQFLPFLSIFSFLSIISLLFSNVMVYLIPILVIVNMGIHYRNKNNQQHYISSLPELLKLHSVVKNLHAADHTIFNEIEVEQSISTLGKLKKHFALFQMENKLQGDASNLVWGSVEIIKILLLLEPILFFRALKKIDSNQDHIIHLFNALGRVDMLYSIASLRSGADKFCIPNFTEAKTGLQATGIYHPLIENCVENDIDTHGKSVLLTGSNMSGKTTFIRSIGINLITSISLNTSFASKFSLPKMRLSSAIRISDDLMNDKSYYFEEVSTIKEIINCSERDNSYLFLLDEIFKGTNTIERISAGKAVLSYLARNNNVVFVSTHDIELTDLLKDEYNLYHFSEVINGDYVDFDYKLKSGKLKTRNAIRILEINQYPNPIIDEAKTTAIHLEMEQK
ncbi:MutS domain V [Marivirga sericea]|uniref:MutS domain V n=1 Tax=Marivirga sericea TaxID=1028 RepID=A0A1X7KIR6_9BACT|nr:hypothetical protein [Marivirga sericea]SMG40534.1 MutS domain V [Marivirga sericea]